MKGEPYGFSIYVGLHAGLNQYLNDPPISQSWCLLKVPEFISSNNVFVRVVKKLCRDGRDKTSLHPVLTEADFQKIKHSPPALYPNTPEGLFNKVWFDVQHCLSTNAQKNHKDAGERNKESLWGFMFAQPGNPLCPVALLEKYLSLLPPNPPAFYLHPKQTNYTNDEG